MLLPPPRPGDDLNDDDDIDIYDERGHLVLAEWTEDGYLVPARPRLEGQAALGGLRSGAWDRGGRSRSCDRGAW